MSISEKIFKSLRNLPPEIEVSWLYKKDNKELGVSPNKYSCSYCGEQFSKCGEKKKDKKKHHRDVSKSGKPIVLIETISTNYSSNSCEDAFPDEICLRTHVKRHHEDKIEQVKTIQDDSTIITNRDVNDLLFIFYPFFFHLG